MNTLAKQTISDIEITKIMSYIVRSIPFVPTRKRLSNQRYSFNTSWGSVEITCRETMNAFDLKVFSALSYFITKNENKLQDAGFFDLGDQKIEICKIELPKYSFLREYMHISQDKKNANYVFESFLRFLDSTWIFKPKNAKTKIATKIIFVVKENQNKWIIAVSKRYLDILKQKERILCVSNKVIQSIKNDTATLVATFLQSHKNTNKFHINTIVDAIHIPRNNRNKSLMIKRAFAELKRIRFVTDYKIKNRTVSYTLNESIVKQLKIKNRSNGRKLRDNVCKHRDNVCKHFCKTRNTNGLQGIFLL